MIKSRFSAFAGDRTKICLILSMWKPKSAPLADLQKRLSVSQSDRHWIRTRTRVRVKTLCSQ